MSEAWKVAQVSLSAYAHRFSPKKFTQHQLFAILVLKAHLKSDYRGITAVLYWQRPAEHRTNWGWDAI